VKKQPIKKAAPVMDPKPKPQQPLINTYFTRYSDIIGIAIIILLGVVVYSNSFHCSFHFDDFLDIVNNPKIWKLSDVQAWWNYVPSRPVGNFTFALNYHFNHLDVRYYHLVNLIFHLINACLVWWLTIHIISSPALKANPIVKHKKVVALLTALLFVSHPLATQSVTYIVQRLASMVTLFYLLSIIFYMKARLTKNGKRSKYLLFTGSFICAIMAMFTKENSFTLPFAILLLEVFFLRKKPFGFNFKDYRVILFITLFMGILIILPLKFSFSVFKPIPPQQGNAFAITSFSYLMTQFSVIVKYIQLLFLPVHQNLDYDFPISTDFFGLRTILSFLVLLSLFVMAIWLFKKQRIISFGIFWFFLTLSVESSIIPIPNVIFEHRTYLPSVGFFLILSVGLYNLLWQKYKYLAISIFVLIIGVNSYLTYERNKVWRDEFTLWNDVLSKSPEKARPYNGLGYAYVMDNQLKKGIAEFSRAITINPEYTDALYNRGSAYGNSGQLRKALDDFSKVIEIDPKFTDAYFLRGITHTSLGQWDKAVADFRTVLGIDPKQPKVYYRIGNVYAVRKMWDNALAVYSKAIELDPDYTVAYYDRGVTYANLKQWNEAIVDYSRAINLDPNYTVAYAYRGIAYASLGQWDLAIADYSRAIKMDPKYALAYSSRGVACMSIGQWDKALADFNQAIEINPKFSDAIISRGVVYEQYNQVDKAIAEFLKALEIKKEDPGPYINLGVVYFKRNNLNAGIDISLKGLSYNPGNANLCANIAYFYMEKGDYQKAIENFQLCLGADNGNFDAQLGLAMTYFYRGDKINAGKYLESAKNTDPRLKKGWEGIEELEKAGYYYSAKDKVTLKKMFDVLK
jgi:protein O-mannosyl-transferase